MAIKKVNTHYDFQGNQIKNVAIDILSTDPVAPFEGQEWYNSTQHVYKYRDNVGNQIFGTSSGIANGYANISDGTTTVNAIGADTITFSSANNILGIVGVNGGAAADTITWTINLANFDTRVRTSRLDQMAAPTATVSMNNNLLTNLTDPVSAQDAANKRYVDAARQGTDWKDSVRAAAIANINIAAPGAAIDGVTLAVGDRVLLFGQTTAAENGIWIWNGAAAAMTRAVDADATGELSIGSTTYIEAGTTLIGRSYGVTGTSATPWVPGSSTSTWTQMFGATTTTAGAGMVQNGVAYDIVSADSGRIVVNADNIDLATVGTAGTYTSITTDAYGRATAGGDIITSNGIVTRTAAGTFVNRVLTGTTNRLTVTNGDGVAGNPTFDIATTYVAAILNGGTGATTASGARANLGTIGKYSATIGDGAATVISITQATHGLASDHTNLAQIQDATSGDQADCLITYGVTGTVTFTFNTAPTLNQYRVVIIG